MFQYSCRIETEAILLIPHPNLYICTYRKAGAQLLLISHGLQTKSAPVFLFNIPSMSNQPLKEYKSAFNIRVYGIFIKNQQLLICDEVFRGEKITKLPGGGLEYGEGTIECLKREFKEEFNLKIEVTEHFYTTDFFQKAQYFKNTQLISIYYYIQPLEPIKIPTSLTPIAANEECPQNLRFVPLHQIEKENLTFPIDKKVVTMLKKMA